MIAPRFCFVLAACLTLLSSSAFAAVPPAATLDARALKPGQKAVVRTVFQGSTIEEFEAEIVGVLEGGRAEGDLILAKATAGKALASGIAMGMSGSPVYVDGKLVGALSGAWPFSRDPLFAITPIAEMLDVLRHPNPAPGGITSGPAGVDLPGASAGWRFSEFNWGDSGDAAGSAEALATTPGGSRPKTIGASLTAPERLPLPLACAGLHPGAMEIVRAELAPFGLAVTPGGRASSPKPIELEPGSAAAIEILRGDLSFSAIGTVTYRDGDQVLLFGHPLFQSGAVRLPLATAEITTIVSSQQASFKLGVSGRPVGVVTQDRRAAVSGRLGGSPGMLPFAVTIAGARPQRFRYETIEDRMLAPSLVAAAALNSLLESGGSGANQTLRWTLRLHRAGAPPLTLSDVAAGESPLGELTRGIDAPLRFLFNNPFDRLTLDSLSVVVDVEPRREQWTLRSARVLEPAVRPGESVAVECEIERWRGGRVTREFDVAVPREAPPGRYILWLGGGTELMRFEAKRLPGRFRPTSLDDAWSRLASVRPSNELYAALFATAPEITREGRDYPELPVSALALLSGDQSAGEQSRPGTLARLDEAHLTLDGLVRGELTIAVNVDPKAP